MRYGLARQSRELESSGVRVHLETDGVRLLDVARCLVKSPGVPAGADVVVAARRQGINVIGELELAWRLLPNRLLAMTGTNGKTTVTELLGHMWRTAGREVAVAGNVGTPLATLVGEISGRPQSSASSLSARGRPGVRAQVRSPPNLAPISGRHGSST